MQWRVPLTTLTIGEEEERAAARALRSGWVTAGEEVEAFEREFAEALGVRYAVAVANATGALALAFDAVGVNDGEEVLMPALTFVASMNVALRRGEVPVLADIASEDDWTMCPRDMEARITPRTALIVTMPYAGFPPDMEATCAAAARHGVPVVEDACHGILARCGDRMVGAFGAASVFSFYGNKNMTTGEGGMLASNDRPLVERVRLMRNHGMTRSTTQHYAGSHQEYDVVTAGHNFRMDDIRAAIGREQLRKLPAANERRKAFARMVRERAAERVPDIRFPFAGEQFESSCHHLLPALLPKGTDRPRFMAALADLGVQTSIHYKPLHRFRHTTGLWAKKPDLPVLESIEPRMVSLPMGPGFGEEHADILVEALAKAL